MDAGPRDRVTLQHCSCTAVPEFLPHFLKLVPLQRHQLRRLAQSLCEHAQLDPQIHHHGPVLLQLHLLLLAQLSCAQAHATQAGDCAGPESACAAKLGPLSHTENVHIIYQTSQVKILVGLGKNVLAQNMFFTRVFFC